MKLIHTLVGMFALSVLSLSVQAKQWHEVKVVQAGKAQSGAYFVYLTDQTTENSEFENKLFRLSDGVNATGLAIALEGITEGRKIRVLSNIDELAESKMPYIDVIYLMDKLVD